MDSACSHPRRNRGADEGIFRLPTPSHLPPPARIRLIKAALESVLKAVWSHDRSLRTSHVPSTLSHSPLARRRLPTSAGEKEVSPYQNRGLEPLHPRLPAHVLRGNLPQPSWLFRLFPATLFPSSPHRCDCCIPIAHRTPRSLRAEATAIRPPGQPGLAHIPQSRLEPDAVQHFALLWSCVPHLSLTTNGNQRVVTCYTPSNCLRSASDWSQSSLSAFLYRLSRNAHMTPPGPHAIQVLRGDRIQFGTHLWLVVK